MNIQLTKKEIVGLYQSFLAVGNLKGVRFAYVIARNTLTLEPEVEAIRKMYVESKEFATYNVERIKMAELYAEKDNGVPRKMIKDGLEVYDIKDKVKFETAIKDLQAKYENAIKGREEQLKQIDKVLEEQTTVDLLTLDISDIPEEIDAKQMTNIFTIVVSKKVVN